jgi:hypothetical protein
MNSKTEQKLLYLATLLLSKDHKKNFESIGRFLEISGDAIERIIDKKAATVQDLIAITHF